MQSIFSVSQPRAGHHAIEMMLRGALQTSFRYCEFYTEPGCCQKIPCVRRREFAEMGYALFLQKSHDHRLADPVPEGMNLILVQVRAPVLRALSNYELALESQQRPHSQPFLQYWLAEEAAYVIGFWKKWVASSIPRRLLLRYEDLVQEPARALSEIVSGAGVDIDQEAIARGVEQIRFSARDRSTPFVGRTLSDSPYFDPAGFGEFAALIISEAGGAGYEIAHIPLTLDGPVTTIFNARTSFNRGQYKDVIQRLVPLVETSSREVLSLLAQAFSKIGDRAEAGAIQDRLMEQEPQYFDGYALRAADEYRAGAVDQARRFIRLGLERTANVRAARDFLSNSNYDPELLSELPAESRRSVSVEAVNQGFRWILGRGPESQITIENHTRCPDDSKLRAILLGSSEFASIFERMQSGQTCWLLEEDHKPTRSDVLAAAYWLLGRRPQSQDEITNLRACSSASELRARLIGSTEFRNSYNTIVGR